MDTRILDRIRKLTALADQNRNPNEAEATAAAAKVQELLMEHNLTMRDIEQHEPESKRENYGKMEINVEANRNTIQWKSGLFYGIAKLNFCSAVRVSGDSSKLAIVGKRSNVEVVCYLADVLISQIERLAVEDSRSILRDRVRYQLEFCRGAASRILGRLREQREQAKQASSACTALVLISERELSLALKQYFPHLRTSYSRYSCRTEGYGAGQRAANGIAIPHGGIKSATPRAMLR